MGNLLKLASGLIAFAVSHVQPVLGSQRSTEAFRYLSGTGVPILLPSPLEAGGERRC